MVLDVTRPARPAAGARVRGGPRRPPRDGIGSLLEDVERLLAACPRGLTAHATASLLRRTESPAPFQVAAVAEELDALVALGRARRLDGQRRTGYGGAGDAMWFPA